MLNGLIKSLQGEGFGVRVRALRQEFDNGVIALDSLDLEVAGGEFVAILGPSGCGKSTLLRLVAGLDRPSSGIVSIERTEQVAGLNRPLDERAARGRSDVAFVFQDPHLLPWRDVLANVALPLELMHVPTPQRLLASRTAIEQVGLLDAMDRYPAQLSGGMRMRVSLARAMVTEPKLLLLDEPFAALDEITRQRLDEQLRSLWLRRRMTVLFVTHSTTEAVFLSERAVVLSARPGRILLDRPIDLPSERAGILRSSPEFARQTHDIYAAVEQAGGAV